MNIALISLDQKWEDKATNKKNIDVLLSSLERNNLDWVIFPEMTLTGFSMNIENLAENIPQSSTIEYFSVLAQKLKVYISFGIILNDNEEKATNNLITVDRNGSVISIYQKIHPFSYANEDKYYTSGRKIVFSQIDNITVGNSICYDLRFPEIFQIMSLNAKIIINIANWPFKRIDHWNTLLKARAIENQVFIIGVNRIGIDKNGNEYPKSTLVFAPDGKCVESTIISEELEIITIDPRHVSEFQLEFPIKQDRQTDFYIKNYA